MDPDTKRALGEWTVDEGSEPCHFLSALPSLPAQNPPGISRLTQNAISSLYYSLRDPAWFAPSPGMSLTLLFLSLPN